VDTYYVSIYQDRMIGEERPGSYAVEIGRLPPRREGL
jgi:hypothetical protein